MPFPQRRVALIPAAPVGMGSSVGAVFVTIGAVSPAAVGVDIGCGMIGVRTQFHASDLPQDLVVLRDAIEAAIPLSPGNYNKWRLEGSADRRARELSQMAERDCVDLSHSPKWRLQLGSLGDGNHVLA